MARRLSIHKHINKRRHSQTKHPQSKLISLDACRRIRKHAKKKQSSLQTHSEPDFNKNAQNQIHSTHSEPNTFLKFKMCTQKSAQSGVGRSGPKNDTYELKITKNSARFWLPFFSDLLGAHFVGSRFACLKVPRASRLDSNHNFIV